MRSIPHKNIYEFTTSSGQGYTVSFSDGEADVRDLAKFFMVLEEVASAAGIAYASEMRGGASPAYASE